MVLPKKVPGPRNNSLFILAILLLVLAGIALYRGSNDREMRSLGAMACVASAYLIHKSKSQSQSVSAGTTDQWANSKAANRPGRLMWTIGAASLLLMGVSYFFLRNDAAQGYHQIWPVYLFFWVMVVCGLFLAVLVGRLI